MGIRPLEIRANTPIDTAILSARSFPCRQDIRAPGLALICPACSTDFSAAPTGRATGESGGNGLKMLSAGAGGPVVADPASISRVA
jgi:hypothetical protein